MKSKITLFLVFMLLPILVLNAQVGIGTTNPDTSSALDITSTDSGLLIPRMTESDKNAISTPAQGLMVYQTDGTSGFYYFDGSWQLIGANDEDWTVSGNSMYTTSADYVGIGNTAPTSKLSITTDATTDAISVDAASFVVGGEDASNDGNGSTLEAYLTTQASSSLTQTFTAEETGFITRVSVTIRTFAFLTYRLSLRNSGGATLATTTSYGYIPNLTSRSLNIAPGTVPVVAGIEYQIHLEVINSSFVLGYGLSTDDSYPNGSIITSSNPDADIFFSTRVENYFDQNFVVDAQGNVGVGTGNPSATLDVAGTFRLRDNGATDGAVLVSDANGNATWQTQTPEAPIPVTTFGSNYNNYNSGYQNPTYYLDRGRVYIEGLARRSSPAFSGNEVIFTLPVGYRPSAHLNFACLQGNDILRVDIFPDGQVRYVTGANGTSDWVTLSGISFRAN